MFIGTSQNSIFYDIPQAVTVVSLALKADSKVLGIGLESSITRLALKYQFDYVGRRSPK